ncbi:Piso0_002409 [Millerozyma farinosa CBS 7064]|uniref:Piso0_002409 protein n=1 Tax=Pichia sorbitophila (strain ATCC MYA-4447 / BCRC 22081 / CBS 7064 / NBRC 10061 / NRRL Y-12695) TaxID=559304 RepID=G8YEZ4_PICSO|nr:Piso0_002409 [Millerozyma farinosa CBS 7064]
MKEINIQQCLETLNNEPEVDEVESILNSLSNNPSFANDVQVITCLLKTTIPAMYAFAPKNAKAAISNYLRSIYGIGNIVSYIKISTAGDFEVGKQLISSYIEVLNDILKDGMIVSLITNSKSRLEMKELDKIVFKGTSFAVVNEAALKFGLDMSNCVFANPDSYVNYLASEILLSLKNYKPKAEIIRFSESLISFNADRSYLFYEKMLDRDNIRLFQEMYASMKTYEKHRFLRSISLKYTRHKSKLISNKPEKLAALATIIEPFFVDGVLSQDLLNSVASENCYNLNKIIAYVVRNDPSIEQKITSLLADWSDKETIKLDAITVQICKAHFLIQLVCNHNNKVFTKSLLSSTIFLESVSNRLNSLSETVKQIGVCFADKVCEMAEEKPIFSIKDSDLKKVMDDQPLSILKIPDIVSAAWDILQEPEEVPYESDEEKSVTTINAGIHKLSVGKPSVDSDDDSSSSDDDDPTIRKVKVPKPVYIKTLLDYLNTKSDHPQAYDRKRTALLSAPTLIRQKANFGQEVSKYANELISEFIGMNNEYKDTDFESLRLNAMIAVTCSYPESIKHLYSILLTGDYSFMQRVTLLTVASLTVRELRGFKDDITSNSYIEKQFPTKMLPPDVHKLFLPNEEPDNNNNMMILDKLENEVQSEIMTEASNEAQDTISGGKILRVSRNLRKKEKPDKPKVQNFSKIVSKTFYFPLVNLWYESGGINVGQYSPLLIAHYLKTISLIMHAAYPIAVDLKDMINEFLSIIVPMLPQLMPDNLPVIESIITGLLLMCDMCDDHYLISAFHSELQLTQQWVSQIWEQIIDDRVKGLCAALLLRYDGMNQKLQGLILDQINSVY